MIKVNDIKERSIQEERKTTNVNLDGINNEASKSDSSNIEYEVQNIIGKRVVKGVTEYKVHWKGYLIKDSTWEPIDNLLNSLEAVEKFEKSVHARKDTIRLDEGKSYSNDTKKTKYLERKRYLSKKRHEELISKNKVQQTWNDDEIISTSNSDERVKSQNFDNINHCGTKSAITKAKNVIYYENPCSSYSDIRVSNILQIFKMENTLLANVEYYLTSNPEKVLTKIMPTENLFVISPEMWIEYYEKHISFNTISIKNK